MNAIPVSGKLSGEYIVHLASFCDGSNRTAGKRLEGVLCIDNGNSWHVVFRVVIDDDVTEFGNLAVAIRRYDNEQRKQKRVSTLCSRDKECQ